MRQMGGTYRSFEAVSTWQDHVTGCDALSDGISLMVCVFITPAPAPYVIVIWPVFGSAETVCTELAAD
jgi:hypothetical protein